MPWLKLRKRLKTNNPSIQQPLIPNRNRYSI
jgi:hypothetical protein